MAAAGGWGLWPPGGIRFADGSVLWPGGSGWQAPSAAEADTRLHAQLQHPLDVRRLHVFVGWGGRERRSVAEARFTSHPDPDRWRLERIALHPDWLQLLCISRGPP